MRRTIGFAVLMITSLLLISCSGGGSGTGVTGGGTQVATGGGKVVDGYVQGAWVYVVPRGETTAAHALFRSDAQTSALGGFSLTGIDSFVAANAGNTDYQLISIGGTNTSTNTPVAAGTVYTAPLGSKVLTPLTTLVVQTAAALAGNAVPSQANLTQAMAQIATMAGIDPAQAGTIMLNTDPVAHATSDANAAKALALELIIAKLAEQKVIDASGSFGQTVQAL